MIRESLYLQSFKELVRSNEFVILDTETTGIGPFDEIVQIALISWNGATLLDTLVKPARGSGIPEDATAIHGITNALVKDAPNWGEIEPTIINLLNLCPNVITYNSAFDSRLMNQSSRLSGYRINFLNGINWFCAMEAFAEVYGEWNQFKGSYKWKKLEQAAAYYQLPVNNAHTALGDCQMTLQVIRAMTQL